MTFSHGPDNHPDSTSAPPPLHKARLSRIVTLRNPGDFTRKPGWKALEVSASHKRNNWRPNRGAVLPEKAARSTPPGAAPLCFRRAP
eukprot:scaffold2183_cov237-Pinguiococcus_pyrenoidosus.AAC.2